MQLRLKEKRSAEERVKQEKENAKLIANLAKKFEQNLALIKKAKQQDEHKQRKDNILQLRARLKRINYYLGRKELRDGEDPVLTLQQLQIVQLVESSAFLFVSDKPVQGYWSRDLWSGKPKYTAPFNDFIDYGANIQQWTNEITNGRIYKWFEEVQSWTSWTNVWPLLLEKKTKYLREIAILTERGQART